MDRGGNAWVVVSRMSMVDEVEGGELRQGRQHTPLPGGNEGKHPTME